MFALQLKYYNHKWIRPTSSSSSSDLMQMLKRGNKFCRTTRCNYKKYFTDQLLSWVPETKPSLGTASRGTGSPAAKQGVTLGWEWFVGLLSMALISIHRCPGRWFVSTRVIPCRALLSLLPSSGLPFRARAIHTSSTGRPQQRHAELVCQWRMLRRD